MQRVYQRCSACTTTAARAPDMTSCQLSTNVPLHLTKMLLHKFISQKNLAKIKLSLFFLFSFSISGLLCTTMPLADHVHILDKQRNTGLSIQVPGSFWSGMPAADKKKMFTAPVQSWKPSYKWNSSYAILESILKNQKILQRVFVDDSFEENGQSLLAAVSEFRSIRLLCSLLAPFADTTNLFEGETYITASLGHALVRQL